jgi:hypothetical protein
MYLSICLSVCLSVYLSIYPSIHLSIYPSIHLSILLSIYPSIHLSIYLFNQSNQSNQSINLSVYQSINQSVHLSIYLSIYQSICLSIYLSWFYLFLGNHFFSPARPYPVPSTSLAAARAASGACPPGSRPTPATCPSRKFGRGRWRGFGSHPGVFHKKRWFFDGFLMVPKRVTWP